MLFPIKPLSHSIALLGVLSASWHGTHLNADEIKIGDFLRTTSAEPQYFGIQDCSNSQFVFCSGSAVAAVNTEFPEIDSEMITNLASSLIAPQPQKLPTLSPAPSSQIAMMPKENTKGIDLTQPASNPTNGLDLTIPINSNQSETQSQSFTASLREEKQVPAFNFRKSYAFLK